MDVIFRGVSKGMVVLLRRQWLGGRKGTIQVVAPGSASDNTLVRRAAKANTTSAPTIVCLCGSTRFSDAFRKANFNETLAGRIVLTIGCDFKSDDGLCLTEDDKRRLDELHKRKIDLADEVLILNVGGYIGESTKSELEYAISRGKRVRWWES